MKLRILYLLDVERRPNGKCIMIKIDIEMVYQIIQHLEWRVMKGHHLNIAGNDLRFNDLRLGDREYRQLYAIDIHTNDVHWMVTVRWDRDHDQFLEAFIAGNIEKLSHAWVLLKLMKDDWSMRIPIKIPDISIIQSGGYAWSQKSPLAIMMHNRLTKP